MLQALNRWENNPLLRPSQDVGADGAPAYTAEVLADGAVLCFEKGFFRLEHLGKLAHLQDINNAAEPGSPLSMLPAQLDT